MPEKSSQDCLFHDAKHLAAAMPENDWFDDMPDKPKAPREQCGRMSLPSHLPRMRVEHDLPELEEVCGKCQGELYAWARKQASNSISSQPRCRNKRDPALLRDLTMSSCLNSRPDPGW